MSEKRLDGQVAWLTGTAQGIGKGIAELFAREGARLALVDVLDDAGQEVANEINHAGGEAVFMHCDVSDERQVRDALSQTSDHFGGLQIIVNCAAVFNSQKLDVMTVDDWDRLMNVNVRAMFLAAKHGIGHLRRNKRSYMVNIGSVGSIIGQVSTPAYITSKGAVALLSRSIALDYARDGLRCNCVCPGITMTEGFKTYLQTLDDGEGYLRKRLNRVPIGVALTPRDIAKTVRYLACEDSAGVTATTIVVDGGYIAAAEWECERPTAFED